MSDSRHSSQISVTLEWSSGIQVTIGYIELGISFLEDWHPPRSVFGHLGVDQLTWILQRKLIINCDTDLSTLIVEIQQKSTFGIVRRLFEELHESAWMLSKRCSRSKHPTVSKLTLPNTSW